MPANSKYSARIVVVASSLLALGAIMVSSSSIAYSHNDYNSMFHHTALHFARILIGILLAAAIYIVGIRRLRRFSTILLLMGLMLSLMIFIPGLSVDVNGATRWLRLGPIVFQPYDMFKLGYILFLAYVLENYQDRHDNQLLLAAYGILGVVAFILLLQPDFGSLSLLVGVVMITLFVVSGVTKHYLLVVLAAITSGVWLVMSEPYRMQRLVMFFDPWSDRYGSGFQLIQALVAEGSGGVYGVGLGQSIQKMLYLPEAHTDFTISIFAEEVGAIGVIGVVMFSACLYILLMGLSRELRGRQQYYESYVVFLAANFIFLQSMFNIAVNYGMLPTKGITLPFMGYGGTSIVSHIAMMGMVLAADVQPASKARIIVSGHRPAARSSVVLVS